MPKILGQEIDSSLLQFPLVEGKFDRWTSRKLHELGFDASSPVYVTSSYKHCTLGEIMKSRVQTNAMRLEPCDFDLMGGVYVLLLVDSVKRWRRADGGEPLVYIEGWAFDESPPLDEQYQYARVRLLLQMSDSETISVAYLQKVGERKYPHKKIAFISDRPISSPR